MALAWTPTSTLGRAVYDAGFLYDPGQDIIYSRMDARQRNFGYAYGYDEAAILMSSILHCEPIFFDYDDKHWMIELWKGQYGLETGCEIGVYTRPFDADPRRYEFFDLTVGERPGDPAPTHNLYYDCAANADRLQLATTLWRRKKKLLTRGPEYHWWLTGFKWGILSHPDELTVNVAITLKDQTMCEAFLTGVAGRAYPDLQVSATTVSFTFGEAFAFPQPDVADFVREAVMADNARIIAAYKARRRENNDPNQVDADFLRLVGLSFLRSPQYQVAELVERAAVVGPPETALDSIADGFNIAERTIKRWLNGAASAPIGQRGTGQQRLRVSQDVDVVAADESPELPDSPSCWVTIDNTYGASDLLLAEYSATRGHYRVSPPAWVPRGGVAQFVVEADGLAPLGGAAGTATYAYCDTALNVNTVQFSFENPIGSGLAPPNQPAWTRRPESGDPARPAYGFPLRAEHSPGFRFVINEHRRVEYTGKDSSGRVTSLSGGPDADWDPVSVAEAVTQIQSGAATYFVEADSTMVPVRVVSGPSGPYLRTAPSTATVKSLTKLPDAEAPV
jgi:hypothetical protein